MLFEHGSIDFPQDFLPRPTLNALKEGCFSSYAPIWGATVNLSLRGQPASQGL
jgi:hypothetical protein